jgi:RNA polymerase sigma-70 factor (ECF subfamily)
MTTDAAAPRPPGAQGAASDAVLARVVRDEVARVVATLARSFGSLDVAEEAVAEAVEEALREWRTRGVPPKPGAWLTQAARHNALDRMRREQRHRAKLAEIGVVDAPDALPDESWVDERLPLLFGCCHPALSPDAQLALTLRAICGLTTRQIARATLSSEQTVAQRIVRAKRKIASAGIPIRVPDVEGRREKLDVVLATVSAMYAQAHLTPDGDASADRDVAEDALWLARVIVADLPDEAEARGLLALLLLHRARESARAVDGELVLLERQDRSRWDAALIADAGRELERAAALHAPGRWQLHAAIAACHTDAARPADTDWRQIRVLYDMLLRYDDTPVVRLNRAVATLRTAGPAAALEEIDALADLLAGYHLWHAVRAAALRQAGRTAEARVADARAWELAPNAAERRVIAARGDLADAASGDLSAR